MSKETAASFAVGFVVAVLVGLYAWNSVNQPEYVPCDTSYSMSVNPVISTLIVAIVLLPIILFIIETPKISIKKLRIALPIAVATFLVLLLIALTTPTFACMP